MASSHPGLLKPRGPSGSDNADAHANGATNTYGGENGSHDEDEDEDDADFANLVARHGKLQAEISEKFPTMVTASQSLPRSMSPPPPKVAPSNEPRKLHSPTPAPLSAHGLSPPLAAAAVEGSGSSGRARAPSVNAVGRIGFNPQAAVQVQSPDSGSGGTKKDIPRPVSSSPLASPPNDGVDMVGAGVDASKSAVTDVVQTNADAAEGLYILPADGRIVNREGRGGGEQNMQDHDQETTSPPSSASTVLEGGLAVGRLDDASGGGAAADDRDTADESASSSRPVASNTMTNEESSAGDDGSLSNDAGGNADGTNIGSNSGTGTGGEDGGNLDEATGVSFTTAKFNPLDSLPGIEPDSEAESDEGWMEDTEPPYGFVTQVEYEAIQQVPAADDPDVRDLFLRLCQYFRGKHPLEEIMWRENLSRQQLVGVLSSFSSILTRIVR